MAMNCFSGACGWSGCEELQRRLSASFGRRWREVLFRSHHAHQFDIGEVKDLVLLMALGSLDSAVDKMYHLLGQADEGARFAHCPVCAWRLLGAQAFPPEPVAAELLRCVDLLISNRKRCEGWRELWLCPPPVLALLHLRLGCQLATEACCTLVCWLGTCCGGVAEIPKGYVMCDSAVRVNCAERLVLLSQERPLGLPLFLMRLHREWRQKPTVVSVSDTLDARRAMPMQLTALRAALQRRTWRWLRVKWLCTLAPAQKKVRMVAEAELPDCTAAAFRDASAAAEWAAAAAELAQVLGCRSKSVSSTAQQVSELMRRMTPLLPFAYSKAVQKVLQLPLVEVNLWEAVFFRVLPPFPVLGKTLCGCCGTGRSASSFHAFKGAHENGEAVVFGDLAAGIWSTSF